MIYTFLITITSDNNETYNITYEGHCRYKSSIKLKNYELEVNRLATRLNDILSKLNNKHIKSIKVLYKLINPKTLF